MLEKKPEMRPHILEILMQPIINQQFPSLQQLYKSLQINIVWP